MNLIHHSLSLVAIILFLAPTVTAQDTTSKPAKPATKDELIKKLKDTLTNAKLTGKFTILGKEDKSPAAEEYTIVSAQKVDEGDLWLLKARIKYGDKDITLPVPIEIQWVGETPIMHERGGIERLPWLLASKTGRGEFAQLVVNQRQECRGGCSAPR